MRVRRLVRPIIIGVLALGACLTQVSIASAGSLNLRDDAGVLAATEQQAIRDSATRAPFSVYVWTVKGGYAGNKAQFVSAADALVTSNDTVIIAVDTVDKFTHIAARNARLTSAATAGAKTTANASFGRGQWAAGITAALTSLTNDAVSPPANGAPIPGGSSVPTQPRDSFPWAGLIVGLVVLGAVASGAMLLLRSRRRQIGAGPQDAPSYGRDSGFDAGSGLGGGAGYGRRGAGIGGMLAGGALGGIAGGLLGYELGKESGEIQGAGRDGSYAGTDQGQGGFVESDQGQGGADWGDSGSGQDFSAGDFGGGSDF